MATFDISPRSSGKSTRAIEWVTQDPRRVLICPSEQEARRLVDEARKVAPSLARDRIISIHSVERVRSVYGPDVVFGVDQIENVLGRLLNADVGLITGTG